jgi:hypothetical protein
LLRTGRPCHTLGNLGRFWLPGCLRSCFLVFYAVALPRFILADSLDHAAWGGSAYNLAAVAACWIYADSIAARRQQVQNQQSAKPSLAQDRELTAYPDSIYKLSPSGKRQPLAVAVDTGVRTHTSGEYRFDDKMEDNHKQVWALYANEESFEFRNADFHHLHGNRWYFVINERATTDKGEVGSSNLPRRAIPPN